MRCRVVCTQYYQLRDTWKRAQEGEDIEETDGGGEKLKIGAKESKKQAKEMQRREGERD